MSYQKRSGKISRFSGTQIPHAKLNRASQGSASAARFIQSPAEQSSASRQGHHREGFGISRGRQKMQYDF
jgi:hypothetical protein